MIKYRDFEQNHYSITSTSFYTIGHDSVRLLKWLAYYDRSHYETLNYYDVMRSVLNCLNEISWWLILRRSKKSSIQNSSNWKYNNAQTRSTTIS